MLSNDDIDDTEVVGAAARAGGTTSAEQAQLKALVETVRHTRAQITALEAIETEALATAAAIADRQSDRTGTVRQSEREMPLRSVAAEFASALRMSDRTMQSRMKEAADLLARFPETFAAWQDGTITRRHAALIHEAGLLIDDVDARENYERMAVRAAQAETPGRLGPIVKALAARFDALSSIERHRIARTTRHSRVFDLSDGLAELRLVHSATLIHGIHDRVTHQAKAIIAARSQTPCGPDRIGDEAAVADERSTDEVRADVVADLLLCGTPAVAGDAPGEGLDAIKATVRVTVPVLTAADAGSDPAVLVGYGPIDAETARRLLGGASVWERVMTSPITGAVLAVDRYQPSADMARYLDARDERCRFPGCRLPARRCDRDHTIEAALGGPTCVCNMEHLCEGHHMLRHATEWSLRQLGGGLIEWTSPLGEVYVDRPEPIVRFVPEGEDFPGFEPLPGPPQDSVSPPQVSWPPPTERCTHPKHKRNPLKDPWLLAHEIDPAPF